MIIDNFLVHPYIENLKAMTVVFLPKNATSITQPMDQSVIRSLKAKYRTLDDNKFFPKFNILKAMLARAWDQVSATTIVNFF